MGNCLKTQLKGSVQSDSLLKVGEFTFDVPSTDGEKVNVLDIAGEGCKISIDNGTMYDTNDNVLSSPYTLPDNNRHVIKYSSTTNTKVHIEDKYNLTYIIVAQGIVDLSAFKYSTKIKAIRKLNTGEVSGDLSNLANINTLTELEVAGTSAKRSSLHGNISNIVNCAFNESGKRLLINYTNVEGDLIEWVRTREANGKTTLCQISSFGNNVKYAGYTSPVGLTTATVYFVNNNKIAFVNGSNANIITYGFTASDTDVINWKANGKNVYDVVTGEQL